MPTKYKKIRINSNRFQNKLLIISGKPKQMKKRDFIYQIIASGGFVDSKVTNRCDYFVKLDNYDEKKLEEVVKLRKQGIKIEIITEDTILEMVKT